MSRVLMIASEATPFVKTGGLADVMGSLPAALARLGDEVAVVLPRYRDIEITSERRILPSLSVQVGPHNYWMAVDEVVHNRVRFFFLQCAPLYHRAGVYNEAGIDYSDNHIRFAALSQAAIGIARQIFRADVLHAHDWPAGVFPLYLRSSLAGDPTFFGTKCILTIHNLGYQGIFSSAEGADIGINDPGDINFLKAGITWADEITTVSPTYAREIQTPEFGVGLDSLLCSRADRLSGILNGVDYEEWNPATDQYLAAHYSARDLTGKRASKLALLQEMHLPLYADRPLIGIISRFADQKGINLVVEAVPELLRSKRGFGLVVLGSGDPVLEKALLDMARARPDRVAVRIGFDEGLAHRIEAGADMFLMPSRYEPCGLNQIYSLRYGAVPIVRSTGGLQDTVDEETGFKFVEFAAAGLANAVREALAAFRNGESWAARMRLGMAKDFSWDASAIEYQKLYTSR